MREPIPTWFFALVVARRPHPTAPGELQFLVVHEVSHGQRWWIPGGRVEAGEALAEAARRECEEESGVPVVLERLLKLEHSTHEGGARVRIVFLARPVDDRAPKSTQDEHSLGAAWKTLAEVEELEAQRQLRGTDFLPWLRAVLGGDLGAPLSVLDL